jgi:hypothetical protein
LFEDKVVDFLFAKAQISDRKVTREALQAEIESTDTGHVHGPDCDHDHDHDHGAKAKKKPAAKKAKAAEAAPAEAAEPEAKPAKKAKAAAAPAEAAEAEADVKPAKKSKPKKAEAAEAAEGAEEAPAEEAPAKKPRARRRTPEPFAPLVEAPFLTQRRAFDRLRPNGGAGVPVDQSQLRIAVLLPCYNEEAAIAQTVAAFRAALPSAALYVYDNNSADRTREVARSAGALVREERMQGKGHVVRRMFADVEADVYVMADGDSTYDAAAAPDLVRRWSRSGSTWSSAPASPRSRRPIAAATVSGTGCSPGSSPGSSAEASPTSSPATESSPAASSRASPLFRAASRPRPRSASTRSSSPCRSPRW